MLFLIIAFRYAYISFCEGKKNKTFLIDNLLSIYICIYLYIYKYLTYYIYIYYIYIVVVDLININHVIRVLNTTVEQNIRIQDKIKLTHLSY